MHFLTLLRAFTVTTFCLLILNAMATESTTVTETSEPTTTEPATSCKDLSGFWKNELGSKLKLVYLVNGHAFTGWIRTGVESRPGASGTKRRGSIIGLRHPGPNGVFSLMTLWAGGSSTVWTGQCYVSDDGTEYLGTTWLLRSPTNITNEWMSTRIGQNVFVRS